MNDNNPRPSAPFLIRDAVLGDAQALCAFNAALAWESEGVRLNPETLARGVDRAFALPDLCRYFVAESGGKVIGQTMVTYEVTDWRDGLIWWIQSVYVDAPWRRLGVFRALYAKVVDAARASGTARMIRLYVEKDNRKAHATYQALGMAPSAYTIYEADVNG